MQVQELSDADADKQGELKGQAQDAPWPKRIPRLWIQDPSFVRDKIIYIIYRLDQ